MAILKFSQFFFFFFFCISYIHFTNVYDVPCTRWIFLAKLLRSPVSGKPVKQWHKTGSRSFKLVYVTPRPHTHTNTHALTFLILVPLVVFRFPCVNDPSCLSMCGQHAWTQKSTIKHCSEAPCDHGECFETVRIALTFIAPSMEIRLCVHALHDVRHRHFFTSIEHWAGPGSGLKKKNAHWKRSIDTHAPIYAKKCPTELKSEKKRLMTSGYMWCERSKLDSTRHVFVCAFGTERRVLPRSRRKVFLSFQHIFSPCRSPSPLRGWEWLALPGALRESRRSRGVQRVQSLSRNLVLSFVRVFLLGFVARGRPFLLPRLRTQSRTRGVHWQVSDKLEAHPWKPLRQS